MKSQFKLYFCIAAGASMALVSTLAVILLVVFPAWQGQQRLVTKGMSIAATTAPFLHRPYYGNRTILQRSISFFDHDEPWYANDHRFVRFDGATWANTSIGSCAGGINCYDGHNGYDLNLWFEPVLSAAAGTVVRANWYNPLNHNDAFGLWVALDHGNGYVTAYGHLSMITVAVGDHVGSQWQIGTSGTTGSSTGPHLHMSVYYLPNWQPTDPFGWTGKYPDPNVVPDRYLWVPQPNAPYTVPDLGGSSPYAGASVLDDSDRGWSATGTWASSAGSSDVKGNMHWITTTSGSSGATAIWHPTITADGYYEIGVYIDDNHASSSWASYTIYSADPTRSGATIQHSVYLDQSHIGLFQGAFGMIKTGPQWVSLGTYYFRVAMNGSASVVLSAATGVTGEQLGADAMEFVSLGDQLATASPASDEQASSIPAAVSAHAPRSYYFAEGYTGAGTTEQLALTNLAAAPATMTVTYYYPNAVSQFSTYQVPAHTHRVLNINQEVGANQSVSMMVEGNQPFTAERTMYTQKDGFVAFTQSQGALAPSTAWYFAEANTTPGWNTMLAVLNPGTQPTTLTMHYLLTPGSSAALPAQSDNSIYTLPPQTRSTIVLNDVLPDQQFGMVLTANNAIVVERAEYLVQSPWKGGSTVIGATAPQKTWYFAAGNTTDGFTEVLVLSNPASVPVHAHLRYLLTDGQCDSQDVALPQKSRIELHVNNVVTHSLHATVLNADGPIVAERQDFFTTTQQSTMRGSSTVMGSSQAQTIWYVPQMTMAEGTLGTLMVTNLNATTVQVQIVLYQETGTPLLKSYTLAAHQCLTIADVSLLATKQEIALAIVASSPVVVEHTPFFMSKSS